jgi:hypothetical protein
LKVTSVDVDGDETVHWRWGSWFAHYYETGEFPPEFGNALVIQFNLIKRFYPKTFNGPWQKDKVQDVLLMTVQAIVHSRTLRKAYRTWNDRQLSAFLKSIIEDKIYQRRRRNHPAWYGLLAKIRDLAKRTLLLIDERKRIYVPLAWANVEKTWEVQQDLEVKLLDVPLSGEAIGEIPDGLIEKTIDALFEAAGGPIPLYTLVTHTLRVLQIGEPVIESLESEISFEPDPRAKGRSRITLKETRQWLMDLIDPLSHEHLLVVFFRTCKDMTLKRTTRNVRDILGLSRLSLETVRSRFAEAKKLMNGQGRCEPWFPKTTDEKEIVRSLLAECIKAKLRTSGIEIEKAF